MKKQVYVNVNGPRFTLVGPHGNRIEDVQGHGAEPGDIIFTGSIAGSGPGNNHVPVPILPGKTFRLLCYRIEFESPYFELVREEHHRGFPSEYYYTTTYAVVEWLAKKLEMKPSCVGMAIKNWDEEIVRAST